MRTTARCAASKTRTGSGTRSAAPRRSAPSAEPSVGAADSSRSRPALAPSAIDCIGSKPTIRIVLFRAARPASWTSRVLPLRGRPR